MTNINYECGEKLIPTIYRRKQEAILKEVVCPEKLRSC